MYAYTKAEYDAADALVDEWWEQCSEPGEEMTMTTFLSFMDDALLMVTDRYFSG